MRSIPEADWKTLRRLQPILLDRLCQRFLAKTQAMASDGTKTHHQRYLDVFRFVQEQNDEIAQAFDDVRRSNALEKLVWMRRLNLFQGDEFACFSPTTRASVESIESIYR